MKSGNKKSSERERERIKRAKKNKRNLWHLTKGMSISRGGCGSTREHYMTIFIFIEPPPPSYLHISQRN